MPTVTGVFLILHDLTACWAESRGKNYSQI